MILELGYIGLSLLMVFLLIRFDLKALGRFSWRLVFLLIGWHIYVYMISRNGFLENLDFPPRFVLFTILPAFLFIGWSTKRIAKTGWSLKIPSHWLIFIQAYRILIELFFVMAVHRGLLHPNVTLEGYNYDLLFGCSALLVGWLVFKGRFKVGILWNYIGLLNIALILFLFQSTIYFPEIYGENIVEFPGEIGKYPYILVPAFLMPTAVFLHIVSIIQLKHKLQKDDY